MDDRTTDDLKPIVESLLFVSDAPLTIDKMKSILEVEDRKTIREILETLAEEYEVQHRAFFLSEVAGGYQLRTRPEYGSWARKLKQSKPPRLSRAAMETLAIIAYKQPVLRTDIEHLRGVDSGGVLRMLLERDIIRVLGRKDLPGRPMVYGTSKRFLEIFNLKDLKNLPTLKDIQALGQAWPSDSEDDVKELVETMPDDSNENLEEIMNEGSHDSDDGTQDLGETTTDEPGNTIEENGEAWPNDST